MAQLSALGINWNVSHNQRCHERGVCCEWEPHPFK